MTSPRWLRGAAALLAATAVAVAGAPAPSARAAPNAGPIGCDHLIGTRDAYYRLYTRTRDTSLLAVVARYTWDATDAGCFGTEPALRQRAS